MLSNSTRKLSWSKISKMRIAVKNSFFVSLIIIFGTLSLPMTVARSSSTWQVLPVLWITSYLHIIDISE